MYDQGQGTKGNKSKSLHTARTKVGQQRQALENAEVTERFSRQISKIRECLTTSEAFRLFTIIDCAWSRLGKKFK